MKTALLALALSAAVATPALAGAPFIRATLRGHPTAGGFIVLSTFYHSTPMPMALTGTAEGLVDGRRTRIALRFEAVAGETGVYVVPRTWSDAAGVYVLNVGAHGAGIVVGVDRADQPAWAITPRTIEGLTRAASASEVESLLAALEAGRSPPELSRADLVGFVARNPVPVAVIVLLGTAGAWLVARLTRTVAGFLRRSHATVAA